MLIDDILGSFANLATLSLARNEIQRVEHLERLAPSLTRLDLSHNLLASLAGTESLTRLVHLDVSHNRLACLGGLEHLHGLETLHAADNLVERTDALRSLAYLSLIHI